jgi:hypothetical protein
MQLEATIYTVGDFVRRVVGSLLQGGYRGKFLCSPCLIKLTKTNLDKSYSLLKIGSAMADVFKAPARSRAYRHPLAPCVGGRRTCRALACPWPARSQYNS